MRYSERKRSSSKLSPIREAHREFESDLHASIMEAKLWGEIRLAAKTDPVLADLLEKVVAWFMLSK